jgi:hypothetical protein
MLKCRANRIAPASAAMAFFLMVFLCVRHERPRASTKPEPSPVPAPVIVQIDFERLARVKKFLAVIEP